MNLLIYPWLDDVTEGATGALLCLLPSPRFSQKMAPSPLKMAACENKIDASGFQCDGATGPVEFELLIFEKNASLSLTKKRALF